MMIGSGVCTDKNEICNGPLKPGTKYALTMRFYTDNGFADSAFINFDTDKQTPIVAIIISFVVIMCIVFVIGFYITYKKPRYSILISSRTDLNDSNYSPRNQADNQFDRKDVPMQNFQEFYNEMIRNENEKIREEYKAIQFFSEGLDKTTLASKVNEKFNRYANIAPFDQNRVVLNNDEFENDYINASLVNVSSFYC
jgi:protein-tyrosine phosphatase